MKTWFNEEQYEAYAMALFRKYAVVTEELTQQQLAEALKQALLCGDFTRHVEVGSNDQQVTYIPYRREQELMDRIKLLAKMLTNAGIEIPLKEQSE